MEQPDPTYELSDQDADLVYSFCAAPGMLPGKSGLVFAARSTGLYRSQDGGLTWEYALENLELSSQLPSTAAALSTAFQHDGTVIAGAPGGVFHSTDGGVKWKARILPNPPPTISALAFSPNFERDETVFAGSMEDGVFISRNGGMNWSAWNFGLLDLNVMSLAVSPNFSNDELIYAGVESGIFYSTNGGRAWREIEMPFGYEAVLSLALTADGVLYAGTENQGLWAYKNETWQRLGEGSIEEPVNALQLTGEQIFAFTSTALWSSQDGGQTWEDLLPEDLREAEISTALAPSDVHPSALLVAFVDGSIQTVQIA